MKLSLLLALAVAAVLAAAARATCPGPFCVPVCPEDKTTCPGKCAISAEEVAGKLVTKCACTTCTFTVEKRRKTCPKWRRSCPGRCALSAVREDGKLVQKCVCGYGAGYTLCKP